MQNTTELRIAIRNYETQIQNDYNILKGDLLGEQEKQLITTDRNAFLLGLISDQSVKAELAWSLPYRLKERLGHLDLERIIKESSPEALTILLKEKPALHRYPSNMAKYIYAACELLLEKYDGDAANIWAGEARACDIVNRLEEFKGISHKKAALGCLLLVRDLDIPIFDKENIDIAYDVHIRRICLRAGFAEKDTLDDVLQAGRNICPEFPGSLTTTFWAIGRDICRPTNPLCEHCPLHPFCRQKLGATENLYA